MSAAEVAEPTLQCPLDLFSALDLRVEIVHRGLGQIAQCRVDDEVARLRRPRRSRVWFGFRFVAGLSVGLRRWDIRPLDEVPIDLDVEVYVSLDIEVGVVWIREIGVDLAVL